MTNSKSKPIIVTSYYKLLLISSLCFGLFCCNQSSENNKLKSKQNNTKRNSYLNPNLTSTENSTFSNIVTKTNNTGFIKSLKNRFKKKNSEKEKCDNRVLEIKKINVRSKYFKMINDKKNVKKIESYKCELDEDFWEKIVDYIVNKDSKGKNNQKDSGNNSKKDSGGVGLLLGVIFITIVGVGILVGSLIFISEFIPRYNKKKARETTYYPNYLNFIQQFYLPSKIVHKGRSREAFRVINFETDDETLKNLLEKLQKLDDSKQGIIKINKEESPNSKSISMYSLLKLAEYHIKDFYYIGLYLASGFDQKQKQLNTKLKSQDKNKEKEEKNSKGASKIISKIKKLKNNTKYKILLKNDNKNVRKLLQKFGDLDLFWGKYYDDNNNNNLYPYVNAYPIKQFIVWLSEFKCAKEKYFRTSGKILQDYIYYLYKITLQELLDKSDERSTKDTIFAGNIRKNNDKNEIQSKIESMELYLSIYDKKEGNMVVTPKHYKLLIEILEGVDLNKVCLGIPHSYYNDDDETPKEILERYREFIPYKLLEIFPMD